MYHVRLNVKSADRYVPYQEFDSLQLINDLATKPSGWVGHVQRYTASISTALFYGWRTPVTNTGYVKDLLEVRKSAPRLTNATTSTDDDGQWMDVTSEAANFQLVDFYSFLRPLYEILPYWALPSKKRLHNLQKLEERVFIQLLNRAKERIASGNACPSTSAYVKTQ